jgi:hypothetical protein
MKPKSHGPLLSQDWADLNWPHRESAFDDRLEIAHSSFQKKYGTEDLRGILDLVTRDQKA